MVTGFIGLFTQDPKQKLANEFIKFVETGDTELLKDYQIQTGIMKFYKDGKGYNNFTLRNKITKEKEHFSVGITPFLCNQESGNYGQELACIRMKQNSKHKNIKTYESSSIMFQNIQQLISNITFSENSRFQNIEDFAKTYLSLNDKHVYPLQTPIMEKNIADGAFNIGNGTAKWNSGLVNGTRAELPVFNETDVSEPTPVSVIEGQGTGVSVAVIAGLAVVGLGLLTAMGTAVCYALKRTRQGSYDVEKGENKGLEAQGFLPQREQTAPKKPPRTQKTEPKTLSRTQSEPLLRDSLQAGPNNTGLSWSSLSPSGTLYEPHTNVHSGVSAERS
jgi:hypothetical protein